MTRKSADDFFIGIEGDIEDERQTDCFRGKKHILVYRVVMQVAGPGIVTGDKSGAVIGQYRCGTGNPRQDALATAGKTGKKVRFNEPFGDD